VKSPGDGGLRFSPGISPGLSVLEVLVAVALFAVVVAAVVAVLSLVGTYGALGRRSTDATTVAAAEVERLRDLPYDRIPTGQLEFTVEFGGSTYHVRRVVELDTPEAGMKQVTVEVTYDLMGPRTYRTQVIFTDLMRPAPVPTP
jgi:Tfp pilus assembly protein PilV